MTSLSPRLMFVTFIHALFSQYGDIMAACMNLMNVPIKSFFNESIRANYGDLTDESFELAFSASASSMYLGLMIAFAIMGHLMDEVGRKETAVFIRGSLAIIGGFCMVFAVWLNRFELYVIGHVMAGMVIGLKVVLIIYVAECSPNSLKGITTMAVNSGGVIVVMLITPLCLPDLFGSETTWLILPIICIIMASIHIIVARTFPQSPKQLYRKNTDIKVIERALMFYCGDKELAGAALEEMEMERCNENHTSVSMVNVLKEPAYRFTFFLVLICAFIPVFSALNVKSQFLCSMLMSYGLTQSESTTAMMVISAISLPICFVSPFMLQRFGSRPVFATLTLLCALEWVGFGFAQVFVDVQATNLTMSWLCACVASILGQSAVNMGLLIMSPILISEICPQSTRAAISQMTQVFPIGFAVAEISFFPTLRESFGSSFFFFLGGCCAALAMLLFVQMEHMHRASSIERSLLTSNSKESLNSWQSYGSLEPPPTYSDAVKVF